MGDEPQAYGCSVVRDLLVGDRVRRVVRHGGRHDDDVGAGGGLHHRPVHFGGGPHANHCGHRRQGHRVGPVTSVTSAPRRAASAAIAMPILPLDRLPMKRTGSMSS